MKEEFVKKITEAGRAIWEIKLFELIMNAIICFLVFAVILTAMGQSLAYGAIPAVVYILWAFSRSLIESNIIGTIERKEKGLDVSLKTAYDNREKDNIIVNSLMVDVSKKMDNVETSAFIDMRKLSSRVGISAALIFLLLFITVIDLRGMMSGMVDIDQLVNDVNNAMKERGIEYERTAGGGDRWDESENLTAQEREKLGSEVGGERPGFNMGPVPGGGGGIGSDERKEIYGEASTAVIEGENVELNFRPDYGGEVEIKEENRGEEKVTIGSPEAAQSAETCTECAIGPEHEELVKRYFEKILKEA